MKMGLTEKITEKKAKTCEIHRCVSAVPVDLSEELYVKPLN